MSNIPLIKSVLMKKKIIIKRILDHKSKTPFQSKVQSELTIFKIPKIRGFFASAVRFLRCTFQSCTKRSACVIEFAEGRVGCTYVISIGFSYLVSSLFTYTWLKCAAQKSCITAPRKVHIFWEGHKILRNLHLTFDWHYIGQG